jgi:hypothetical protein
MTVDQRQAGTQGPIKGTFHTLPQMVRVDYEGGFSIEVPADFSVSARLIDDIGPIVSAVCKLFPRVCGGGGGGDTTTTGQGCYTIITPDGTKITICPPSKAA